MRLLQNKGGSACNVKRVCKKKHLEYELQVFNVFGGDERDRTVDLCVANASLSQLSYIPVVSSCS